MSKATIINKLMLIVNYLCHKQKQMLVAILGMRIILTSLSRSYILSQIHELPNHCYGWYGEVTDSRYTSWRGLYWSLLLR